MVMVQFNDKTVNIEGQFGGQYYRHDQCLQHIQAMPRVVHGRGETAQQRAFGRCKIAWSNHEWTDFEIMLWWIWCYNHPKKNKKGEIVYLHPFLAFLSVNIKRILQSKEIVFVPPI